MSTQEYLESYLKTNPELADNLKEGSIPQLAAKLSGTYVVRADKDNNWQLVHRGLNEAVDTGSTVKKLAWDFLKRRGNGRYLPRFLDRRTEAQRLAHQIETRLELEAYLKKSSAVYVSEEPKRVLLDWVAKNCLFEGDGKSMPTFALMHNGVVVERFTAAQLEDKIARYQDPTLTEIADKKLNARFRKEALELQGLEPSALNDPQARTGIDRMVGLLKDQYFAGTKRMKLPKFDAGELEEDLTKEVAFDKGFPVDSTQWDLTQRREVHGAGARRLE